MLFQHDGRHWLVHAPAKLNLFLEIIGRRDDGYHDLETCMASVDLYDSLRFYPASGHQIRLSVSGDHADQVPCGDDNLVVRAARLLQTHSGCSQGASVQLTKRIPAMAGLGGGSSDAAATLAGLNRLWRLGLPDLELHQIAARLGSDLNFFLANRRMAICRGRGEVVQPVPWGRRMHFVVACPQEGASTAEVFRACQVPSRPQGILDFLRTLDRGTPKLHNRLQHAAAGVCPRIRDLGTLFGRAMGSQCQMTGSGSAWFGMVPSRRVASRLARTIGSSSSVRRSFAVSTSL